MIDMKWVRENPALFDQKLQHRHLAPLSKRLMDLDENYRALVTQVQELQEKRNTVAKDMAARKRDGADVADLIQEGAAVKAKIPELELRSEEVKDELHNLLMSTPNVCDDMTPVGANEKDNQEIRVVGDKPAFDFKPKEHYELGESLGLMDFETAARMSGSRFVILRGALARLERALLQFMLNLHTGEFGYTELATPLLVRSDALYGTGQLPKLAEDQFKTTNDYWLIPTSEVTLTNTVHGKILEGESLPLRLTAGTACFRSEAGAAGKDTRGMLRQHQFMKVELVSITTPDQSEAEHQRMTGAAEEVLKRLKLPYRTVILCSGDLGFNAQRTYDIEVWMPGQNTYREISSCSNCGAHQARRMNARYRTADKKTEFVHTLNGSGIAVGRALIAVMENYQQADGSIKVPDVLVPYMGGLDVIR